MQQAASARKSQDGVALLGALMLVLILSLLGATLLNLAGQESVNANAAKAAAVTQQLADAAGQVVVAMFHSPGTVPPSLASMVTKKGWNPAGFPSFFDQTGQSQFVGTVAAPDLLLDATGASDNLLLNDPQTGLFRAMQQLGTIQELKIYAPSRPGLLCTVDATVSSQDSPSVRQSVTMQLGVLDVPPLRAGVQVGQSLGVPQPGKESPVSVHWGHLKVKGDLALQRADELPTLTAFAAVTGQEYDDMAQREDRWMEAWIGGEIRLTELPADQTQVPALPQNVHVNQTPSPGVQLDLWDYDQLKAIAQRHGRYFAIDREGLLYPQGVIEPGRGISPDIILQSHAIGDQGGIIFVDTLDQQAPRADNLGTVNIHSAYLEGILVVQGHIVFSPGGPGQSFSVLSPPTVGPDGLASPVSVQLTQVQLNGILYAAGNITLTGKSRIFGAVTAGGTVDSSSGGTLEVWYNHEYGQGFYRGLPVVYPASGTWMAKY